MYPNDFYYGLAPQHFGSYMPSQVTDPHEQNDLYRQQPQQVRELERRVNTLERQNEEQITELTRLNNEIRRLNREIIRINQEINRLNQNDERTFRRINRLNQRLRTVENRLTIPFHATEDGFDLTNIEPFYRIER